MGIQISKLTQKSSAAGNMHQFIVKGNKPTSLPAATTSKPSTNSLPMATTSMSKPSTSSLPAATTSTSKPSTTSLPVATTSKKRDDGLSQQEESLTNDLDADFLAALPEDIRAEVIQEHFRQKLLEQPRETRSTASRKDVPDPKPSISDLSYSQVNISSHNTFNKLKIKKKKSSLYNAKGAFDLSL
jgi:hypothetical protein